jgi:hypothetical protein
MYSVLTKPVYERDLLKMLVLADERRKAALTTAGMDARPA